VLQILEAVRNSQVTIIAGETGCGKTTQVPQMLLEDCAAQGRTCKVLCSQPRRISTVSVASRVAAERGEQAGRTSGYSIRLESAASDNTALLFVTTGVPTHTPLRPITQLAIAHTAQQQLLWLWPLVPLSHHVPHNTVC
jgi:HrpA-like RNA helicase